MRKSYSWLIVLLMVSIIAIIYARMHYLPAAEMHKYVRAPVVAGSWYPGDRTRLNATVAAYLDKAERRSLPGRVRAVIVPHAGYAYSGQVDADGFKQIDSSYRTVILLGTSHHYPLEGLEVTNYTDYETPLGLVKVSAKTKDLFKSGMARNIPEADAKEHSIEIELPFLQEMLGQFELMPIIVGMVDANEFLQVLNKQIDDETLVVVSVDLSHYHPYDDALKLDNATINNIMHLDSNAIFSREIDSEWAVSTLLLLAKQNGWTPHLVKYTNSGDVSGDKSSVVGYAAIAFTENQGLSSDEQEFLLQLARKTLESYVTDKKVPVLDEQKLPSSLTREQGCFVTLNKQGRLRGCIGHILPQEALYKCVIDNAVNAAVHDSRFNPVASDELKDIKVEISVLTIPKQLQFSSGDDLKNKLVALRDGVVLNSGWHQSTYLPQVWEDLPDKEDFLSTLCEKGGANANCWKDTSTAVYTYQAQVFAEK